MTQEQVKWAASHDWFHSSNGNTVLVREVVVGPDRRVTETMLEFKNFQKLRDWAGY